MHCTGCVLLVSAIHAFPAVRMLTCPASLHGQNKKFHFFSNLIFCIFSLLLVKARPNLAFLQRLRYNVFDLFVRFNQRISWFVMTRSESHNDVMAWIDATRTIDPFCVAIANDSVCVSSMIPVGSHVRQSFKNVVQGLARVDIIEIRFVIGFI